MIAFEKALDIVKQNCYLLGTESVEYRESLNRVLRQDVFSDIAMPPFHKSAMDGFACRRVDLRNPLNVVEVIPAGSMPLRTIGMNQCAKIMTGAPIPEGADCVIIVEETQEVGQDTIRFTGKTTTANICMKGEDVVVGQKLLSSGTRITAKEIASLALAGCTLPVVSRIPKVGIITTGDEIVEPDVLPRHSQIRNTSSYQLIAQCRQFCCEPLYYGIVKDTHEAIGDMIARAKRETDLLLLTGGVSMGDFDLVPSMLKEYGYHILFDKVASQPGKPTVFGRDGSCFVFGLPGNPVSSFVVFELFVKEFLSGMMGLSDYYRTITCSLAKDIKRKKNNRRAWVPVKINAEGKAESVEYHGSAHISSLVLADGIVSLPPDIDELKEGDFVDVRQI